VRLGFIDRSKFANTGRGCFEIPPRQVHRKETTSAAQRLVSSQGQPCSSPRTQLLQNGITVRVFKRERSRDAAISGWTRAGCLSASRSLH
jgi:hypothetical protein